MVRIGTRAGVKSPVEVSAEILRALRARAEASLGGPIDGAVVTVPAYFDDAPAAGDQGCRAACRACRSCAC